MHDAPPVSSASNRLPWLAWVLAGLALFLAAILYPLIRDGAVAFLVLTWLVLAATARSSKRQVLDALSHRITRNTGLQNGLLVLSTLVVFVGGLELMAQILTRSGVLTFDTPMKTMLPEGAHDWRLAHITADKYREADPVLFWHPVAREPYTKQRFRGPVLKEGPSPDTFRIFCYGDSNTDGPTRGGSWPEQLQHVLDQRAGGKSYEVINAGVAGYSSHQGLLRLRQEIERYRPDLVLVSFGWNDAAGALGVTDRDYLPPSPAAATVQRLLLKYRFFLVAKHYLRPRSQVPEDVGPRVSLEDYRANLQGFLQTSTSFDARVVFLTRPHRQKPAVLAQSEMSLMNQIPLYNDALRQFSADVGATMVDVQKDFEIAGPDYFVDEAHFSLDGHLRMAQRLVEELSGAGMLQ